MPSLPSSSKDQTIMDPESLTDKQLLRTSLSQLSKNLPHLTSSHSTITIYLRWLEIHRVSGTGFTEHWGNALLHWGQSLRSRGFRESELVSEVRKWKRENPNHQVIPKRPMPDGDDISKAFMNEDMKPRESERGREKERDNSKERKRKRDIDRDWDWDYHKDQNDIEDSYRSSRAVKKRGEKEQYHSKSKQIHQSKSSLLDKFNELPPKSYICNRCGKKGHHLQVCPTNMDPEFDQPPDNSYVCTICDARGAHFVSLCPQNKDPYSIIQRRKLKGIVAPTQTGPSILSDWELEVSKQKMTDRLNARDRERGHLTEWSESSRASTGNSDMPVKTSKKEKLQEIDDMKAKLFSEESAQMTGVVGIITTPRSSEKNRNRDRAHESSTESGIHIDESSSPYSAHGKHKRVHEFYEEDIKGLDGFGNKQKQLQDREVSIQAGQDHETGAETVDNGSSSEYKQFKIEEEIGALMGLYQPFAIRLRQTSFESMITDETDSGSAGKMDLDELIPPATEKKTISGYSDFIRKLMQRRGEMGELVNSVQRRPTAADMWKLDNQWRRGRRLVRNQELSRELAEEQSRELLNGPTIELSTKEKPPRDNDNEDRSPSQESIYYEAEEMGGQFDGASDDKPVKNLSSQKRIGAFGREAVEMVKEISANTAESRDRRLSQHDKVAKLDQRENWKPGSTHPVVEWTGYSRAVWSMMDKVQKDYKLGELKNLNEELRRQVQIKHSGSKRPCQPDGKHFGEAERN